MRSGRTARWLLLSAIVGCGRCGSPGGAAGTSDAGAVVDPGDRAFVEHSGCAAIARDAAGGPVCELPESRKLRVWVPVDRPEDARFSASTSAGSGAGEDARTEATPARVGQGFLFTVALPIGARTLTVEGTTPRGKRTTRLALATTTPLAWFDEAKALRLQGKHDEALARLAPWLDAKAPADRARALGLAARVELARGNVDAALGQFREAIRVDRLAGRISDAADDAFALVFALNQRGRGYAEARAILEGMGDLLPDYPDGRAREPYYRGLLDGETGAPRASLHNLREAGERARRLGLGRLSRNASMAYALALHRLGRTDESLASLRALEEQQRVAEDVAPCEKVELAINVGFAAIVANEEAAARGSPRSEDAMAPLEYALSLRDRGCPDPYLQSFALGNLALAALDDGKIELGRARLREARGSVKDPRNAEILFWHDLEGLLALGAGDPKRALVEFDEERRLARATLQRASEWDALIGRGRALEALRRPDDALAAYREAEALLDDGSLEIPLGEGRNRFLGGRDLGARSAIELLVQRGRAAEAMAIARASRARVLRGVEQALRLADLTKAERARWDDAVEAYRAERAELDREAASDWKLPGDALARVVEGRRAREAKLRAALDDAMAVLARGRSAKADARDGGTARPPDDALTLVFHPGQRGFVGFAADASGVLAARLGPIPPERIKDRARLAETLLAPFRERLRGARRIRVLSYGALRDVDFHALPFDGATLLHVAPIAYPLDTGQRAEAPPAETTTALVVADPNGDLPAARREARLIADALTRQRGWRVNLLEGEAATSSALERELKRASFLHYAGHGVYAGREGWESVLPLAAGGHLLLGDILALAPAPARVVLSSCESARTASDAPAEGLGLAQAFIAAGSESVVAAVRPVEDGLGAKLSKLFYERLIAGGLVDAPAVLREAQLAIEKDAPMSDWPAFRVLLP